MDRRNNESYEEFHKKFVEAMQKACVHDDFDDYPEPDIDISFIYEDTEEDMEAEVVTPVPKKKRFGFTSRFNKVAAILVILLLSGNILLLATNSNDSYGHKGLLHRLSETVTGVVTDNDNPVDGDEVVDNYTVYDENEINQMVKKFPDLYIPTYIPNGYEFESLDIKVFESGDWSATFAFYLDDSLVCINELYCLDAAQKVYYSEIIEKIEIDEKTLYIRYDSIDGNYTIDIAYDTCIIEVSGSCDKNELIKIASNIKKAH